MKDYAKHKIDSNAERFVQGLIVAFWIFAAIAAIYFTFS